MLAAYRRNYPGIELYVHDGVHGTVVEDVRSGAADFGITYLDELPDPFVSIPLGREEFAVVLPRNHRIRRESEPGARRSQGSSAGIAARRLAHHDD